MPAVDWNQSDCVQRQPILLLIHPCTAQSVGQKCVMGGWLKRLLKQWKLWCEPTENFGLSEGPKKIGSNWSVVIVSFSANWYCMYMWVCCSNDYCVSSLKLSTPDLGNWALRLWLTTWSDHLVNIFNTYFLISLTEEKSWLYLISAINLKQYPLCLCFHLKQHLTFIRLCQLQNIFVLNIDLTFWGVVGCRSAKRNIRWTVLLFYIKATLNIWKLYSHTLTFDLLHIFLILSEEMRSEITQDACMCEAQIVFQKKVQSTIQELSRKHILFDWKA